ncbi:MAG: acyltransferase family protein [Clostridiales bacterium]|nr:acyltransferase family protein [Clostridiales bacterium]
MKDNRRIESLDYFKIIAAFLVVAIHTSPLASFNADADFIFTRIIARCAVPFFLMVTGYFILPKYLFNERRINSQPIRVQGSFNKQEDLHALFRFIKKNVILYIVAVILYLPINFYAGHFKDVKIGGILRMLIFDGTFYHLWYLPASVLGVLIVFLLGRRLKFKTCFNICLLLYFIGLAGDSYYGLITEIPYAAYVYDTMFKIFSYTRNGIFYAPIFLMLGAYISRRVLNERALGIKRTDNAVCFLISLLIMTVEGLILHHFNLQRHDSMYIALPVCMYFLFRTILDMKRKAAVWTGIGTRHKNLSMLIYIIHPLMIIVIRGIAKLTGLEKLLVDNSLVHYIGVCILSCAMSMVIERVERSHP